MANLLDIIFPKYCVNCKKFGDFLCPNCFSRLSFDTKNICLTCTKPSYDGLTHPKCRKRNAPEGSFTGVVFNPISKKLIYQFKYKPYLSSLSSFLADLLYESLIQDEEFNKIIDNNSDDIVFVPVPLSSVKHRKRGYNQAEILAKNLSKKFGFVVIDCLDRIKETRTQVGLSKKERQENMKSAFSIKKKFENRLKNKTILLVDDVLTTGSTLSEATKVLKSSGSGRVWGVAFAREQ